MAEIKIVSNPYERQIHSASPANTSAISIQENTYGNIHRLSDR